MTEASGGGYRTLFRHESFGSFLSAGAFQFAAPSTALVVLLYVVALAYPASERGTYGAIALSYLGLSSALPTLAGAFFAGPLADRHDRTMLMRAANLFSLLATAGLALDLYAVPAGHVAVPGPPGFYLPVWILLAYPAWAALIATATLFRPAYNTTVPRLVGTVELGRANGLIYAVAAGTSAGGTLIVGGLLTVSSTIYALAVPFLLFFATQIALLGLRPDLSVVRTAPSRSVAASAREGFAYLFRRRDLFELTIAALVMNFLSAIALVELALYVVSWLGLVSGIWYGAMTAAATAGAACGLVAISHLKFEARAGRVLIVLMLCMGLALLSLGLVRSIWLALPIVFIYGLLPGMIQTVFLSSVQATVPDEMMGRVFAADEVGSYALVPLGQWAGGVVTVEIGVQGTYLAAGGAIAALGVLMAGTFRALRGLSYRPREADGHAAPG